MHLLFQAYKTNIKQTSLLPTITSEFNYILYYNLIISCIFLFLVECFVLAERLVNYNIRLINFKEKNVFTIVWLCHILIFQHYIPTEISINFPFVWKFTEKLQKVFALESIKFANKLFFLLQNQLQNIFKINFCKNIFIAF